ncbi:MAG: ABC transporter permease [Chloroflexi bacterium]|uniref:ABC transporter permease n=1 Tax=Candidatus Flexifilum breve TaxID=3140694 RepID=UPI003136C88F|nr:ABC transporter permease [Chloroflexota bacterium]
MSKILALIWKELYTTYTDRNLLLIMVVTPLALATIIGTAFSGFFGGGSDAPIRDIPVALVNLDAGVEQNGQAVNNGDIIVDLLVPPADASAETLEDNVLFQLTNAVELTDADAARAGVDDGTYAAAIIIPADFSAQVSYGQNDPIQPTTIELYASSARPTSASVLEAIVQNITNTIATGNITIQSTIDELIARAQSDPAFGLRFGLASSTGTFAPDFTPAFDPANNPLRIEQQTVTGEAQRFNPLVLFGSAQAIFFMMFTAIGSATGLLEERRDGTLQRQLVSPTARLTLLVGKFIGVFLNCLVQVALLALALTLVGSLLEGQFRFIWGDNLFLVALTLITVALATGGIGTFVVSLVKTPEQANILSGVIGLLFGVLGGAFFSIDNVPVLNQVRVITPNYWGVDAFTQLALNQGGIEINLIMLTLIGAIFFIAGVTIFNRRLEV